MSHTSVASTKQYGFDFASPNEEMGAYEALWIDSVSSFKQVRAFLRRSTATSLSQLMEPSEIDVFFNKAVDILHSARVEGFGVHCDGSAGYPTKLYDAECPLPLLYYQGRWDLVSVPGVSIIGTRKPSEEGRYRTKKLVEQLVRHGLTIYSGLAAGIDTIAHRTAIDSGGKTIAVIGTPLSRTYPKENIDLQRYIAKKHLLVSQVPICRYEMEDYTFNKRFFPERNITMSALSEATIIVEAGETSGTLIQARAALKQGRKLFILNNCFENKKLTWPQKFEKQGAVRVTSFEDIEKELSFDD